MTNMSGTIALGAQPHTSSPPPKAGFFTPLIDWWKRDFERILAILAMGFTIVIGLIQIFSERIAVSDRLTQVAWASTLITFILAFYIMAQARAKARLHEHTLSLSNRINELSSELAAKAREEDAKLHLTELADQSISECFHKLEIARCRFDDDLLGLIHKGLKINKAPITPETISNLEEDLDRYLEQICNFTCEVINAKKGLTPPLSVSANIKGFTGPKNRLEWKIIGRSTNTKTQRYRWDSERKAAGAKNLVDKHYCYHQLFFDKKDIKDSYLVADRDKLLTEIDAQNAIPGGITFDDPRRKYDGGYDSSIVVPIRGPKSIITTSKALGEGKGCIVTSDEVIIGLICVDFTSKDFFNDKYDETVLKQIAAHVFNVMRAFYGTVRWSTETPDTNTPSPALLNAPK